MRSRSLNGGKTKPLTDFARGVLKDLLKGPIPCQEINNGVVDRLIREDLAKTVQMTSPYKIHKGGTTAHLQITEAGRQEAGLNKAQTKIARGAP